MSNPFEDLSPDSVIAAAEAALSRNFEPVVTACNSYVNRVYALRDEDGSRCIVKFYRPDRWDLAAIEDEHRFIMECAEAELPVVPPLPFEGEAIGSTGTIGSHSGCFFSCFPFKSGRTFDVTGDDDYRRIGSLIGRLHAVSRRKDAPSRVVFDPGHVLDSFCRPFARSSSVHPEVRDEFMDLCASVLEGSAPLFSRSDLIRIHGDCHRGNILDRADEGLLLIDFDDMMTGPAVQDLWLLLPGYMEDSRREMSLLLEGYETFTPFNRSELALVETLRFMRMLYFLWWMDSQRGDALFEERYADWGSRAFWIREMEDLRSQSRHALARPD
jgi:Ser/Thr protein kinase RdoA (MazF antagonist)